MNGILGVAGVASAVWSGGTDLLYGKYMDQTENMMAACYAARYFGILAMEDQIAYYPSIKAEQKKINEMLAELMANVQCNSIQMGMT